MYKFFSISIVFLMIISTSIACSTTPVAIAPSTTPLTDTMVKENLGKTEGSDATWSFLGLWMYGKPDIDLAIKEALAKKQADALINVQCYQDYSYYIFFSTTSVRVIGDAVVLDKKKPRKRRR